MQRRNEDDECLLWIRDSDGTPQYYHRQLNVKPKMTLIVLGVEGVSWCDCDRGSNFGLGVHFFEENHDLIYTLPRWYSHAL